MLFVILLLLKTERKKKKPLIRPNTVFHLFSSRRHYDSKSPIAVCFRLPIGLEFKFHFSRQRRRRLRRKKKILLNYRTAATGCVLLQRCRPVHNVT